MAEGCEEPAIPRRWKEWAAFSLKTHLIDKGKLRLRVEARPPGAAQLESQIWATAPSTSLEPELSRKTERGPRATTTLALGGRNAGPSSAEGAQLVAEGHGQQIRYLGLNCSSTTLSCVNTWCLTYPTCKMGIAFLKMYIV